MKKNNKILGFTVLELIVILTLIVVLSFIGFNSYSSYLRNARDGKRVADLNNIKYALERYYEKTLSYPIPTYAVKITYSGSEAWQQGTVGNSVLQNIGILDKIPKDPLTSNEYTYSITNIKDEFQLGGIYEAQNIFTKSDYNKKYAINEEVLNKANSDYSKYDFKAMITGNYNGKIIKISSGTTLYILGVPSIINGDITNVDVQDIIARKNLVYNNYSNIPDSYKGKGITMTGGFDFGNASKLLIFSGSLNDLKDETKRLDFIEKLKDSYNNTIISNEQNIKDVSNLDLSTDTTKLQAIQTANIIINNYIEDGIAPTNQTSLKVKTSSRYPGCDTDDITLSNGQIWSACNVGAITAWTGTGSDLNNTFNQQNIYGKYFQFGRNKGFAYGDTSPQALQINGTIGLNEYTDSYGFIWTGSYFLQTWANTDINNNWGGSGTTTLQTYYDVGGANQLLMKGPCADGYHIPTKKEWQSACDTIMGHNCNDSITNPNRALMVSTLKLPSSGMLYSADKVYYYQGYDGAYLSSSISELNPNKSYTLSITSDVWNPGGPFYSNGYSVRCLKN